MDTSRVVTVGVNIRKSMNYLLLGNENYYAIVGY